MRRERIEGERIVGERIEGERIAASPYFSLIPAPTGRRTFEGKNASFWDGFKANH